MCVAVYLLVLLITLAGQSHGYSYRVEYIDQEIDHFSFTPGSEQTFRMKYLINDTYGAPGGPILFYTGNEGTIEMFCENTGFIWDIAPGFQGFVVFAEHRYYGDSQPFGKDSYSNASTLGYLTSEQALADFAKLIPYLKMKYPAMKNSPVVTFGGSYGGMLAAWMRMKYPHLVVGAIASSAPVLQFQDLTDCNAFYKINTDVYTNVSYECSDNIRRSWKFINSIASTEKGRLWLGKTFKLCDPLKSADDLKYWLSSVWTSLAMINYPYPANFLNPVPANPVKVACSSLTGQPGDYELLQRIFEASSVYFNYTGNSRCLNLAEEATSDLGILGWNFQACTEMVMPMCSNGKTDMFEPFPWNFTRYKQGCEATYAVSPKQYQAVTMYGGRDMSRASNIVFSNGLLDPWSGGGVLKSNEKSVVVLIIPEGAHHLDLRSSNPMDPQSVIDARRIEKNNIRRWIRGSETWYHYQVYRNTKL